MVMRRSGGMLVFMLVALVTSESPVESLDAGEIAEVDDGDFTDVFDSRDVSSVDVHGPIDHMGPEDMRVALNTWEVLYGDDHPNLGVSQEITSEASPKVTAAQTKVDELTQSLLKSTSEVDTKAFQSKLTEAKKALQATRWEEMTPEQREQKNQADIKQAIMDAKNAQATARSILLSTTDSPTSDKAKMTMDAMTKKIEEYDARLKKAQQTGDLPSIQMATAGINESIQTMKAISNVGTAVSPGQDTIVAAAEQAMNKFIGNPQIFAKVTASQPIMITVQPKSPGQNVLWKGRPTDTMGQLLAEKDAKAVKAQTNAETTLLAAKTSEQKQQAKKDFDNAERKVIEVKVQEAQNAAKTGNPIPVKEQESLVAPIQELASQASENAKEKTVKATEAASYARKMAEKSAELAIKEAEGVVQEEARRMEQVKKESDQAKENARKTVDAAKRNVAQVVATAERIEEQADPKAAQQAKDRQNLEKEEEAKKEIRQAKDRADLAKKKKKEAQDNLAAAQKEFQNAQTQGQIDRAKETIQEQKEQIRDARNDQRKEERKAADATQTKDSLEERIAPTQATPAQVPPADAPLVVSIHIHEKSQPEKSQPPVPPVPPVGSKTPERAKIEAEKEAQEAKNQEKIAEDKANEMKKAEELKLEAVKTQGLASRAVQSATTPAEKIAAEEQLATAQAEASKQESKIKQAETDKNVAIIKKEEAKSNQRKAESQAEQQGPRENTSALVDNAVRREREATQNLVQAAAEDRIKATAAQKESQASEENAKKALAEVQETYAKMRVMATVSLEAPSGATTALAEKEVRNAEAMVAAAVTPHDKKVAEVMVKQAEQSLVRAASPRSHA